MPIHSSRPIAPPARPPAPSPQVHEMISVTAIQEAQQSAVAAFEDFMDSCMDSEWQQVRSCCCLVPLGPVCMIVWMALEWQQVGGCWCLEPAHLSSGTAPLGVVGTIVWMASEWQQWASVAPGCLR